LIVTDGSKLVENVVHYCAQNMLYSEYHVLGMVNTRSVGSTHRTKLLTTVLKEMSEKAVDKTAQQLEDLGIHDVRKHVSMGIPVKEIQRYIQENDIGLLVIGLEARGGERNFAFGKLGEKILREIKCPTLIVNNHLELHKPKIILSPTDGKTHSDEAGAMAITVAQHFNAQICKIYIGTDEQLGKEVLQRAKDRAIAGSIEENCILDITDEPIAKRILRIAPEYDMIVMGKGKKRFFRGDDLAHVAKEIIAFSPVPVLLVGSPGKTGNGR